jgi:hypothetical protein
MLSVVMVIPIVLGDIMLGAVMDTILPSSVMLIGIILKFC